MEIQQRIVFFFSNLNDPLSVADPEVYALIRSEKERQRKGIEMIASENFTSVAVLDCLASCLHNKYSEGMPNARWSTSFILKFQSFQ